jgi:hypothetical protein
MTDDDVDSIEGQLGVTMPVEYRSFVRNPAAGLLKAYGGHEFFTDARFVVNSTRGRRSELIEPRMLYEFVVIGEPGNGDFTCLDLSQEPAPVVEFDHERREFRTVAYSFESWVRKLSRPLDGAT